MKHTNTGETVRACRKRRGVSAKDLAGRLGVKPSEVSRMERCANSSVRRLEEALGALGYGIEVFDVHERGAKP